MCYILLVFSIYPTVEKGVSEILSGNSESAAVMLKPKGMEHEHEIVNMLMDICDTNNLDIVMDEHLLFSYRKAFDFYSGHKGKWFRQPMAEQISDVILHGFEVNGHGAIEILRAWVGPTDPAKAKKEAPESPRALCGEGDMTKLAKSRRVVDNAIHVSSSVGDAERELDLMIQVAR